MNKIINLLLLGFVFGLFWTMISLTSDSVKDIRTLKQEVIKLDSIINYNNSFIDSVVKENNCLEYYNNKVENLIKSIHYQESRLQLSPKDGTSGDKGPFQITAITVKEYNNQFDVNYTHNIVYDYNVAREMCLDLLNIGARKYYNKYQKYPTISEIARMWNGGIYNGYRYASTEYYGESVLNYYINT